jgi:hypothetical protein
VTLETIWIAVDADGQARGVGPSSDAARANAYAGEAPWGSYLPALGDYESADDWLNDAHLPTWIDALRTFPIGLPTEPADRRAALTVLFGDADLDGLANDLATAHDLAATVPASWSVSTGCPSCGRRERHRWPDPPLALAVPARLDQLLTCSKCGAEVLAVSHPAGTVATKWLPPTRGTKA